nr:phospholipase-like protein [Tanacetum cinerariifolium]
MAGLTVFILYDCVFKPLDSLDCCAKLGFREFGDLENSYGFWAFVDNLNQLMIQLRVQLLILQKRYIMTMIIRESKPLDLRLVELIVACVRKENQIASRRRLRGRVLESCAV